MILKIDESDLRGEDGLWLSTTGDQAIMLPMLEMAHDKSRYISDILYVYNVSDMTRDTSVNEQKQIELANYVRSKKKYNKIDTL